MSQGNKEARRIYEDEIKNVIGERIFKQFDTTIRVGDIDFCVAKRKEIDKGQQFLFVEDNQEIEFFLWAESKDGNKKDIYASFVQLMLTIGKARTFETFMPPIFLGAFDEEKIAFIHYSCVIEIFYKNDFNWNVRPSDHDTKEFHELYNMTKQLLESESLIFYYHKDAECLKEFIENNFVLGNAEHRQIQVSKSNFTTVYLKWLEAVKPTIDIQWDETEKLGIIDADFFLADLLSKGNETLKESLFVLLKNHKYDIIKERKNELGLSTIFSASFRDGQKAHEQFWKRYKRPPRKDFWQYIVERRDLLVPQGVRERKGSYFTPQIWVEKSQEYLTRVLGENWQDEYYIWDCCAGTGNMERGLINKYNVFASTLDKADVDVMIDQIHNGMNLLESHVFQFDFLNDDFDSPKIPAELKKIIHDEEKRKKLLIYINPPYAEATNSKTISSEKSRHKAGISQHLTYDRYKDKLGRGINEIFAHFLIRIYTELKGCLIGQFSKLKHLQSENFSPFREHFQAKLYGGFIVPAHTFDNVKGKFPIGFFIWNSNITAKFEESIFSVYNAKGKYIGKKKVVTLPKRGVIAKWIQKQYDKQGERIAYMVRGAADFQNNNIVFITLSPSKGVLKKKITHNVTVNNIVANGVYFAVRHCINATWINDRDQFVNPETDSWASDYNFQSDCLVFTLFHNQNTVKSKDGINHWIPFKESDVQPQDRYESHVMINHMAALSFTNEAQSVLDAAKAIYRYYHKQPDSNPNASFYDIREYFQGRKPNGKMNNKSDDEEYSKLMKELQCHHNALGQIIAQKVYEHGFLLS